MPVARTQTDVIAATVPKTAPCFLVPLIGPSLSLMEDI